MLDRPEPYTVACVAPDLIGSMWAHVRAFIREGQRAGGAVYDEDATLKDLRNKDLLLWVAYRGHDVDAAALTRLIKGMDGLQCHLIVAGGSARLAHWPDFITAIEQYARSEGCVKVCFAGRLGWKRVFSGYVQTGVVLEKRM